MLFFGYFLDLHIFLKKVLKIT